MSNTPMEYTSHATEIKHALDNAINKWLFAVKELGESQIRPLIPVQKAPGGGELKTSFGGQINSEKSEVILGVKEQYAVYVEFGTGIYAENGNGRKTPWIYKNEKTGHVVRTNGQMPRKFMRTGFRIMKPQAKALLQKYIADAIGNNK